MKLFFLTQNITTKIVFFVFFKHEKIDDYFLFF